MKLLRIIGKGLHDTFEQLLPFALATLCWWVLVFLTLGTFFGLGSIWVPLSILVLVVAIPLPGATTALFFVTDPRLATERPDWREVVDTVRDRTRRAWIISLITIPPTVILAWDLFYYSARNAFMAWLIPVWFLLLVFAIMITLSAFSALAMGDASVRDCLRRAVFVVGRSPFSSIILTVLFSLYAFVGGVLVVPALIFVPTLICATINRFVLRQLEIPIPDPLAPTEERVHEERAKKLAKVG